MIDALKEVDRFGLQPFRDVHLRRPHVARTISDEHLIPRVAFVAEFYAFVVYFHLLADFQIVVHDHLAAAANQRPPKLDRRQPVHVHVRDGRILEKERQVGHVLRLAADMSSASGRHRAWLDRHHVVHDREIMDRQIPNDVDVGLEDTQVDPRAVDVEDLAQVPGLHQIADLVHRAGVHERVTDHEHDVALCRRLGQFHAPA